MPTVLVATRAGLHRLGDDPETELDGEDVTAVAQDAQGRTWALIGGSELRRREDDGTWSTAAALRVLTAHCLTASGDALLVGTSEAHLLRLAGDRLEPDEAFDRAEGRDTWYTPWGAPADTRSLDVAADGTVYANVHVGGILRGGPGQQGWTPTIDVEADVHEVRAGPGGTVLAATARGLARSPDQGMSWSFWSEGLPVPYARAVAVAGRTILLSASSGPSTRSAALHRAPLEPAGQPFEPCAVPGSPFAANIDSGWVDARDGLAAVATPDGAVWTSTDEGASWEQAASGLPGVRGVRIV